ncbi:MAG TPA: PDZ domain-containing protein [Roseiflexaceae bacterium]|nr:PDZ domain-containing protein [Roseiflexaceae bacterium]
MKIGLRLPTFNLQSSIFNLQSSMITYTISMPEPHAHLYHVSVEIDALEGRTLDVALPVWTPGSYMIREFARHVQGFQARAGSRPLEWRKLDKATWRVETGGAEQVCVSYQVYAFELSVRTSHLDGSHGYFNPANLCMYVPGRTAEPLTVHVVTPEGWQATSGLERVAEELGTANEFTGTIHSASFMVRRHTFAAEDYDHLADSPFECGTHRLLTFAVDGVPHEIAIWGRGNEDEAQILADTQKIVETARDLFGQLPYARYVFILHLVDGQYASGLEHRNSVTNMFSRWGFRPRKSYERFLGLTAHEFYHVWNVKRIRPAPLGPFDYSRENYTRQLWVAEGITSYYDNLIMVRAGLVSHERYAEILAEDIKTLQSQPGRALQSLAQSSFDAWIKLYRPDENSANSSISYYLKGSLVALLLDLEIRGRTGGERALDDVMRYLHQAYPPDGPGFPEERGFLAAVEAVAGQGGAEPYRELLERYVDGTEELDYDRALGYAGLRLEWGYSEPLDGGAPAWHGLRLKTDHGALKVHSVRADGPAYTAGIYAGDEILALDGARVDEERLKARVAERRPGDVVTLSLFRRDELLHVPLTLAPAPPDTLRIVSVDEPSDEQRRVYESWLGSAG